MAWPSIILPALGKLKEWYAPLNTYFATAKSLWDAHIAGTADKHAANKITYDSTGNTKVLGNNVDAALESIETELVEIIAGDANAEVGSAHNSAAKAKVFVDIDERFEELETETITHMADTVLNLNDFPIIVPEVDSSGRLQRAIAAARTEGKRIFVPPEIYSYSTTLDMFNHVSFVGQSRIDSILNYTGVGDAFNFIDTVNNELTEYGYGCYYNTFENLTLYGDGINNGSTCIKGELRYSSFINVTIRNFETLIEVNNNWTNNYVNCLFATADIWYKAASQNNAVTFTGCQFSVARIGFQMQSCYDMSLLGGNIESCTEVILRPTQAGGCKWSAFAISNLYFENTAPLIDSTVVTGTGDALTSWEINGFSLTNCNINYFVSAKSFIYSRVDNIINGEIRNCVFYKSDDTTLIDLSTTKVSLSLNKYFYFNAGVATALTTPISAYMTTWNTGYQSIVLANSNRLVYTGVLSARAGFDMSFDALRSAYIAGTTRYEPNTKTLHIVNTANTTTGESVLQPVKAVTSAARPPTWEIRVGMMIYDTDLGKPLWCHQVNPTIWHDSAGTVV
jgi:hypothetical protein